MSIVLVGSARHDENGKYSGGKAGDQIGGREVDTQEFYIHKYGWFGLRAKDQKFAEKIAERMNTACKNNHIGYDQSQRGGIILKGIDTKDNTECDCSTLVRECVKEATGKDPGNFTTSTEKTVLLATGLFENLGIISKVSQVKNGDILVSQKKGHTVIVVSGAPYIIKNQEVTNKSTYNIKVIVSSLNVRSEASVTGKIVTSINRGSIQMIDKESNGWGHLANNAGWISLKYTERIS